MKSAILLLIITAFTNCSCHQKYEPDLQKFDKSKWETAAGKDHPYRDAMLKDLMESKRLMGLHPNEVVNMIGAPERKDTNYFFYTVSQKRLGDFFVLSSKSMVIKFADDTVARVMIHE